MSDTPSDRNETFCQNLPDNPTADHVEGVHAVPKSLSKELGDYAEGDYAVSCKTNDAPTMEETDFNSVIKEGL